MIELVCKPRITLVALLLCVGCAATEGNGVSATETRTIGEPFEDVRVSDSLVVQLTLSPDDNGAIEVESDENLVPMIITEIVRGRAM